MRINDLVNFLNNRGHKVTVLTGKPNYPNGTLHSDFKKNPEDYCKYKGTDVVRVPLFTRGKTKIKLIVNYFSFLLSASTIGIYKLKGKKFDIIFANQLSPILSVIPGVLIKKFRKLPLVLWVLDLWPETLEALGIIRNKKVLRFLDLLSGWIYQNSDCVMIQSRAFKESILRCSPNHKNIIYRPNWAEAIFQNNYHDRISSNLIKRKDGEFHILFAGNVGLAQDFNSIISAAKLLKNEKEIFWNIVGDGSEFDAIRKIVNDELLSTRVIFHGRHPLESMPDFFQSSDALLISLSQGTAFSKTIPGKLQSYMASGKPILSMIDGESDRVIRESRGGLTARAGDYKKLASNIILLSKMTVEKRKKIGDRAFEYFNKNFESKQAMLKIEEIMKKFIT